MAISERAVKDLTSILAHPQDPPTEHDERRRSRRRAGRGALLLFEVPTFSRDFLWPARLVDINGDGLAMKLPAELVEVTVGGSVYLSMLFKDRVRLDRVPATFVRQKGDLGAVEFQQWRESDRLKLLDLLLEDYAAVPPSGSLQYLLQRLPGDRPGLGALAFSWRRFMAPGSPSSTSASSRLPAPMR